MTRSSTLPLSAGGRTRRNVIHPLLLLVIPGRAGGANPESRKKIFGTWLWIPGSRAAHAPRNDRKISAFFIVLVASIVALFSALPAFAASDKEPAPAGAFEGAPAQYTRFTAAELTRGFLTLAFGSDLRVGARPRGIRRFDHPISIRIFSMGRVDRGARMRAIIEEYARKVPNLRLSIASDGQPADIDLRLIDEQDFKSALIAAFGVKIARIFVARTNPQCMTSVKSNREGDILYAVSFIIVDKGDRVFLDCAYHELLHAFGLSNHDQRNRWTTLNQKRMVGYLTVYDRALLTLLYDPRVTPGMGPTRVRALLPGVIADLGLAAPVPAK